MKVRLPPAGCWLTTSLDTVTQWQHQPTGQLSGATQREAKEGKGLGSPQDRSSAGLKGMGRPERWGGTSLSGGTQSSKRDSERGLYGLC